MQKNYWCWHLKHVSLSGRGGLWVLLYGTHLSLPSCVTTKTFSQSSHLLLATQLPTMESRLSLRTDNEDMQTDITISDKEYFQENGMGGSESVRDWVNAVVVVGG